MFEKILEDEINYVTHVEKLRSTQDLQSRYHIAVHCVNKIEKQNNTNHSVDKIAY